MLKLIFIFFKIGFISFGGGWTTIGLIKNEIISNGYMTINEFSNAVSISQMTPGPIAINMATYIGYQNFGFFGALLTTISLLIPPVLMLMLFNLLSKKLDRKILLNSLKLGTVILIFNTFYSIASPYIIDFNIKILLISVISFFMFFKTKIDPILIIIISGILGIVFCC